jgi:hypothetical protein
VIATVPEHVAVPDVSVAVVGFVAYWPPVEITNAVLAAMELVPVRAMVPVALDTPPVNVALQVCVADPVTVPPLW